MCSDVVGGVKVCVRVRKQSRCNVVFRKNFVACTFAPIVRWMLGMCFIIFDGALLPQKLLLTFCKLHYNTS